MKSLLFTCLLMIISINVSIAQDGEEDYHSKEADAYYKQLVLSQKSYIKFKPEKISDALKIPFDFVRVISIENAAKYNPRQGYWKQIDSLMQLRFTDKKDSVKHDSVFKAFLNENIGIIPKTDVIKQGHLGDKWAILYTDLLYDDCYNGGAGYWIALSNDNGKNWKKYYTGLTKNYHFIFKMNSKIPLWKDENTLQVESIIVRMTETTHLPLLAEFEKIQDDIAVQLYLPKIMQDTDNDGLTDIVEDKMMLNPNNPDTDGDGIPDAIDKNPRFKSVDSEKGLIYQVLIELYPNDTSGNVEIDLTKPLHFHVSQKDSMPQYNILVTDDSTLQSVNLQYQTLIIMSTKEYSEYIKKYPAHFIECSYTPLFKCDNKKDTYKINYSQQTHGETYIVQKTKKGWRFFSISGFLT